MNVFFIADTHFGHRKIITFPETKLYRDFDDIEQHDEELIKRWNSVVKPNDKVFHLGDVAFGSRNLEKLARLNGSKRLVAGNHDKLPSSKYLQYFKRVSGAVSFEEDYILTHIPVHPSQLEERWKVNIHGHLHTNRVNYSLDGLTDYAKNYWCVSAEQQNLTPISFEDLRDKYAR